MNETLKDIRLLPGYYKKIAVGILIASILPAALNILGILSVDKEIGKTLLQSGILLSLLILAISRNKVEDELTLRIRLKAFTASFIYGVVIVIIDPLMAFILGESLIFSKGATALLISMLLFYFLIMFIMKRNR